MNNLVNVQINEEEINRLIKVQISESMKNIEFDLVFWDSKILMKMTCMSWNTIQEYFFHDKEFPKYKVGSKWIFPVKETKAFLESWIKKQSRY